MLYDDLFYAEDWLIVLSASVRTGYGSEAMSIEVNFMVGGEAGQGVQSVVSMNINW